MTSVYELTKNIVDCGYECEAGPLENNIDFRTLVQGCQFLEDALVRERELRDLVASAAGDKERSLVAAGDLIESLKEQLRRRPE